jgi:exosortase
METTQTLAALDTEDAARRTSLHWRWLLVGALVLWLYAPILWSLVRNWWNDANYSHGFFVPLLSAYFIWRKQAQLAEVRACPSWVGLPVVLAGIALLFFGSLGAELFLTRTSLVVVLYGLVLYFCGRSIFRALVFPLSFLLLMVPLPAILYNQIVFPLQLLASGLATFCLQQSQILPVLREGNVLVLPSGKLEVVEACSGIRSLMSLITLAAAYGYLTERRNWIRLVLVVAIVPIAVVSNAFRILLTALLTERLGPAAAEGTTHFLSGLVLFGISVASLLVVHAGLRWLSRMRSHTGAQSCPK